MTSDLREELDCSICMDAYADPVMLRCGHNFCQACIESVLDSQERSGLYTCPECRKRFNERPVPQRNAKLCNIVQHFISANPEQKETGVFCTYCDVPVTAVKTCVQCEMPLCGVHLQKHNQSVDHVLSEPTTSSCSRKCNIHNELLKYYCSMDSACVCVSCCLVGDHRGHQVETLSEASEKKKDILRNVLEEFGSERVEAELEVQSLQNDLNEVQEKAAGVTQKVTALFRDLREQLKALEQKVLNEISTQEEWVSHQLNAQIHNLEVQMYHLSRKTRHIEQLCEMTDPLSFLRESETAELHDADYLYIKAINKENKNDQVGDVDEFLISIILHTSLDDIVAGTKVMSEFNVQENSESDILLNEETARFALGISGDLKTAYSKDINRLYLRTPGRFKDYDQVLSTRSFSSGRHYWEVETSKLGDWSVGMSYPTIKRKGMKSSFGCNKISWTLSKSDSIYSVVHDSKEKLLHPEMTCHKLGLYLDYEAGRLSFYKLCEPIGHLHTFTAAFTAPLHVAVAVEANAWVRFQD
ncbi:E3 ubiquitin/ISG15 ligase TRIM25-like [Rhinophrynus dorsalis]